MNGFVDVFSLAEHSRLLVAVLLVTLLTPPELPVTDMFLPMVFSCMKDRSTSLFAMLTLPPMMFPKPNLSQLIPLPPPFENSFLRAATRNIPVNRDNLQEQMRACLLFDISVNSGTAKEAAPILGDHYVSQGT